MGHENATEVGTARIIIRPTRKIIKLRLGKERKYVPLITIYCVPNYSIPIVHSCAFEFSIWITNPVGKQFYKQTNHYLRSYISRI